ncbi:CAP-Gly domain-containing linker protein 1-like [Pollicipes pollicipes]|uniref:CAP-Gly domain-containing linker protein 1-like n=1 Tax=Pollicipes pollicipes TaxID=41117 RepID=UPI001884A07F|nr:CAP-Gly domain-containing linker protein 1-like [Pollicipes pollicipes]
MAQELGDRVWVSGTKPGQIMYIGETQFAPGEWAGVVLDTPDGKNNGSVAGVRYFMCEQNRGIFSRLTKLSRTPLGSTGAEADAVADGRSVPSSRRSSIAMGTRATNASMVTSPMDSSMISSPGEDLELGDKVIVSSSSGSKTGLLRYLGKTEFAEGQWAGVELETPSGKNDGTVAGKRYFSCRPNYGLFAPAHKISRPARRSSQKMGVHALRRSTSREVAAAHAQLQNTLRDERHRAEELQFSAEEAAIVRAELERERADEVRTLAKERDEVRLEAARAAADINENMQRIMLLEGEASRVRHEADDELASLRAQLKKRADEQRALAGDDLERQLREATGRQQAAERRADQLQTQLDTWRRDGELLKERVTALKDFADGKAAEADSLAAENKALLQRVEESAAAGSRDAEQWERKRAAATTRLAASAEACERSRKAEATLRQEAADRQLTLSDRERQLAELEAELAALRADKERLAQQVTASGDAQREADGRRAELERLRAELDEKSAAVAALTDGRAEVDAKLAETERRLEERRAEAGRVADQLRQLQRSSAAAGDERRAEASCQQEELQRLRQEVELLKQERDSREEDAAVVRQEQGKELERLKKELSSKEGDSAAARQEQQEELEKLKLELESVMQDATAIQQQQKRKLERLTEELASKEADGAASRQKLEKELERLEQELASKKQDSAAVGQEQKQELERLKQKLNSTERENAAFRREQEAKLEQLHEELDSRDRDVVAVRLEQREELERQQQELDDARREAETSRRLLLEVQQRARPAPAVPLTNGAADAAGHVDFLNSVIADLQGRNDELTRQVRLLAVGDEDEEEEAASPAAPARPPPRLWCDICEEFDRHDTDECPTQASTPEEPPPSRHGGARGVRRQFCMACEMFGHTADQCDAGETF